ncbi:unnamed protein product [Albugo candida]|uniref:Uncharacterized protein n=1 Tax=Albugo candida TaxID=65357 RepID=A0A024FWE4_9STRA|nr:unnamed protein product [Albugo candida]|eukprot:CCI11435.1 unnamed protein product [Albugo candida]
MTCRNWQFMIAGRSPQKKMISFITNIISLEKDENENQATSVHQVKWARHWNQYDRLPPDTENGIETVLHTQIHDPTGFHIDDSRRKPCDLAKRYNGISCSIFFKPMLRNLGSSRVSSRELNWI